MWAEALLMAHTGTDIALFNLDLITLFRDPSPGPGTDHETLITTITSPASHRMHGQTRGRRVQRSLYLGRE